MRSARLIANPSSGADRAPELLRLINAKLRTIVDALDITITVDADDAERAGARAVDEGVEALFVAGGDGTLNTVLRGVMSAGRPLEGMTLGLIPLGTGNDFAKALDVGVDPEPAIEQILQQRTLAVDVGTLNGRPFVNTSAGGFVAEVSEAVTESLKDATGRLAYLIGGARALLGSEPFKARLVGHNRDTAGTAWLGDLELEMFAIGNARTIGGGYPIAPDALVDDGLLDVFLVQRMPLLEFVGVLQTISAGQHTSDPRVLHFRSSSFDLQFDRPVRVNTDGELFVAERCEYRIRHRTVRFFCGPHPWATPST